jgi:hypothetical protein
MSIGLPDRIQRLFLHPIPLAAPAKALVGGRRLP